MAKMVLNINLNVESLEIGKNSMVVARCDKKLSPKISDMLQSVLRGRLDDAGFKGVPVFVADKGVDLSVVPIDAVVGGFPCKDISEKHIEESGE